MLKLLILQFVQFEIYMESKIAKSPFESVCLHMFVNQWLILPVLS